MDFYNTNQEIFLLRHLQLFTFYDGDAMKHLQPVLAITAPPYPY